MRSTRLVIAIAGVALLPVMGCATRTVYVPTAPPAARAEVKPAKPGPAYVWRAGHWDWRGGKHVWVSGHWVKAKKGKAWVPGHWKKTPRGWVWKSGHWKRR